MVRALLILGAGIAVAVLFAVLITPIPFFREVLVPVLVTTAVGMAVMAVVARRSRIRQREEELRSTSPNHQEPDRG